MKGKRWVLTAAMLVAGIRLWMQVRGKTKTPFAEWAIGWGVTFMFLALLAESYPAAAGPLAGTIVTGDFLVNGSSLFDDLTGLVTGATGGSTLVADPFAATAGSPAAVAAAARGSSVGASIAGAAGQTDVRGGGTAPYRPPAGTSTNPVTPTGTPTPTITF